MAVDITNHLIPWAIAKRMQADAWDEGYDIGGNDVGSGWREDELTKNPYREDARSAVPSADSVTRLLRNDPSVLKSRTQELEKELGLKSE